ncbi:MAG: hypothetical protein ACM3SM_08740 [Bacteroidota bacterium]
MKIFFRLVLTILFAVPAFLQAQDDNKNVELPDFVITGVERVTIQNADKPKTEPVPILSKDFFKPVYSTEELPVAELSNPIKKDIRLLSDEPLPEGTLTLAAGIYTMPAGSFSYNKNLSGFLFNGSVWGLNQREYDDHTEYNNSGLKLGASFFPSAESGLFHGLQIDVSGRYNRESYRFFASQTPDFLRNMHEGNLKLNFRNMLDEKFNYGLLFGDDIFYLKDRDLNENVFSLEGFTRNRFGSFEFNGNLQYKNQTFEKKISDGISGGSFFNLLTTVDYKLAENLKVGAGIMYASADSMHMFSPVASIAIRLSDQLSIFGSFKPEAHFMSLRDITLINRYYEPQQDYLFYKSKNKIEVAARYEYETYFEINAGMSYAKLGDYYYFTDTADRGFFSVNRTDGKQVTAFGNLLFHLGPYGKFYGGIAFNDTRDNNDKTLPYQPFLTGDLRYSYKFDFGLSAEASVVFSSKAYTDSVNSRSIPGYFNAGGRLGYDIMKNFEIFTELSNLFDNKNYLWRGYKQKPIDIAFGIQYRW